MVTFLELSVDGARGGTRGRGGGEGVGGSREVKFQTVISQKRLEITVSIWYAFFS